MHLALKSFRDTSYNTLLIDACGLDYLCPLELVPDQGDVYVHVGHGALLLLLCQGGVGTGQCPGQLVRQLWQNAADEPLPSLTQHVYQEILQKQQNNTIWNHLKLNHPSNQSYHLTTGCIPSYSWSHLSY